jgi:hypothetical protein
MATLIEELTPAVVARAHAERDDIIGDIAGPIEGKALHFIWPEIEAVTPRLLKIGYEAILDKLGTMTIGDFIARLNEDMRGRNPQ